MSTATVRQRLSAKVEAALGTLYTDGFLQGEAPAVELANAKQEAHGDFACTVALAVARAARKNPREIATRLQAALGDADGMLVKTDIAGPGYLNLFVTPATWWSALEEILETGSSFLESDAGKGQRVLLEFVSANPTGPLHIAHGRGAVTGDVLARLLKAAGYEVEREYYVNDLGHQVDVLARSVYVRYQELHGRKVDLPEDFYPGEYVAEIAQEIMDEQGDSLLAPEGDTEEPWLAVIRAHGVTSMQARIRSDLEEFGIKFDRFVSERELTERIGLSAVVDRLAEAGHVYEQEGKRWFKTTEFGDDKDRVVIREDGRPTYFASDIAYHDDKLGRGFTKLINIWGADHGGYITRVKSGISALGWEGDPLEIILVQMVSLVRGGEAVRMGKRLGTAIWLRDVVAEAGRDATRYFFAMRRSDSQLEFDIALATRKSLDNPVYYAQMGHARMCSIARKATSEGIAEPTIEPGIFDVLTLPEELGLIKAMCRAPEVIAAAAETREPHQVVHYIQTIIGQFHSYYTQYKNTERVISDDAAKTRARLLLCRALQTTLHALLEDILGVGAPQQMYLDEVETNDA